MAKGKQTLFEKAVEVVDHAIHPSHSDETESKTETETVEKPAVTEKTESKKSQGPDALAGHAKFAKFKTEGK